MRLTLPSPNNVSGSITVAGMPLDSSSTYQVRAEYQGKGKLNDFLSVAATAQPDGTFVLRGLTAGTYLVQAARDGIWLSQSSTLVVTDGKPITAIALDIPSPGSPVLLHLTDPRGNEVADQPVTFDIPAGPLKDTLWPKAFQTDGHGYIRFDGFSAGKRVLYIGASSYFFVVPEYASNKNLITIDLHYQTPGIIR